MPTPYKLKLLNGVLKLKTFSDQVLSILGIKDLGTRTGNVTNGVVDWSIQHFTKTTAEWTADTTTILLDGQIGVENTGTTTYKFKIGNGVDLWSALGYAGGGSSSGVTSFNSRTGVVLPASGDYTKSDVGLGNVDNTSDANKPISSATQTALNNKEPLKGSDDNYVTDAQLVVIGNTSGTNTGDQTRASLGIDAGTIIVTSGTSFTTPSNITTSTIFLITLIGGGGGGAATATTSSTPGGGAGGYCFVKVTGLSPSTTYTCAIGAAGAGGAAGGANNGANGGNTTLTIGATTYTANGGTGAVSGVSTSGGVGGTATNGDVNIDGQAGGDSPAANAAVIAGEGGNSIRGWGFGGQETRASITGHNGVGYGSGGAGGKTAGGGSGTQGIIYCEYFN